MIDTMTQKTTYYDLLGLVPEADLEAISAAYLRLSRELSDSEEAEDAVRLRVIKRAFEVLSDPARRADYDAGLRAQPGLTFRTEMPGEMDAMLVRSKRNPVRMLLTIIATLMIVGLVLQVGVMFNAYKRVNESVGSDPSSSPAADKVYLQDFYQTYGIRAASREEAELLLADMQRKEAASREADSQRRQQEEQERSQRRFEEESRRLGAQVTAANQYAEEQAQRVREEETRRKEAQEKAQQEAERMKRESEIARFRGRGVPGDE